MDDKIFHIIFNEGVILTSKLMYHFSDNKRIHQMDDKIFHIIFNEGVIFTSKLIYHFSDNKRIHVPKLRKIIPNVPHIL